MSKNGSYRHESVLLNESVDLLVTDPHGVYVDVTFGGGGHSKLILSRLSDRGRLIAFDRDGTVEHILPEDSRFTFIHADFRYLKKYLRYYKVECIHGILADLGLSSHHLDTAERGFSYFSMMPLDMRMNKQQRLTAAMVLQTYPEKQLIRIFSEYGELTNAKQIVAALLRERQQRYFVSCQDFSNWIDRFAYGKKLRFLAQAFQAIRMEVNHEMDSLESLLEQGSEKLISGGRMVVISYHSLEDRLVKQWFKSGMKKEKDFENSVSPFRPLVKHAIQPGEDEIKLNSRSRSAKMRVAVKQ